MAERVAQRPAQPWLTQDERGQPKAKRVANFLLLKSDGPISGLAKNGDTILKTIEFTDNSKFCINKEDRYNVLKFTDKEGKSAEIVLFFDHNTIHQVVVQMAKNENGRGPYKLVRNGEDVYVFCDWHYEQPDDYVVIDAVYLDGEQIDGTEEENQDLIEQIYNWELFR